MLFQCYFKVIYEGKTPRCLPRYTFHANFNIGFSKNHWSNKEKAIIFFKKVVFPCFKNVHVIMDTFKRQDNEQLAKLRCENNCVLIIASHKLNNKFQPLDVTFNKPAKLSSKRSISYGLLNRLLNNLKKAKI